MTTEERRTEAIEHIVDLLTQSLEDAGNSLSAAFAIIQDMDVIIAEEAYSLQEQAEYEEPENRQELIAKAEGIEAINRKDYREIADCLYSGGNREMAALVSHIGKV